MDGLFSLIHKHQADFLFSVPATEGPNLVKALHDVGVEGATIVGVVESFSGLAVRVTK